MRMVAARGDHAYDAPDQEAGAPDRGHGAGGKP